MNIEQVINTAHISITSCFVKVAVSDLSKYKTLWKPRYLPLTADIDEEDPLWRIEMGFPAFVEYVSPWYDDNTLSLRVSWPFDMQDLSDWLKKYE